MATWKKVIVSGSSISQLNNDAGFIASIGGGIVSGSEQIDINNTSGDLTSLGTVTSGDVSAILPAGTVSGSSQITITESQISDLDHYDSTDFGTDFAAKDTDDLTEGSTNLYYTDARARQAITVNSETADGSGDISLDTDTIGEGSTNLYYTDARVKTKLNAEGVISGSSQVSIDSVDGFTSFSSSIEGRVETLETSDFTYTLDVTDGTNTGAISDAQTLAIVGTTNETTSEYDNINRSFTIGLDSTLKSKIDNIEANADVTDTDNVRAAGALMDDEITNLSDVKAFDPADYATAAQGTTADAALPASDVSAFGLTLIDDANAAAARTTLGVDASGTDNSTDVTLAGSYDYLTISGQVITLGQVDASTDISGLNTQIDNRLDSSIVYSGSNATLLILNDIDQNLETTADVNFNGITIATEVSTGDLSVTNDATVAGALTVTGNLTVNGVTTTINTSNLEVEDRFIFLNEGSGSAAPAGEGGIIVEGSTAGQGEALFFDGVSSGRWAVASDISKGATSANPAAFMANVYEGTRAAADTAGYNQKGNLTVESNGDIYIWS